MNLKINAEPESYEVQGKTVRCYHCQHSSFWVRKAQLNSALSTFFKLDWTDQSATCLICSQCGYIHWFLV